MKPRAKVSPEQWREARRWWDAELPTSEIARRLDCTPDHVNDVAKRRGWPRRHLAPRTADRQSVVLAKTPVPVRCPACYGVSPVLVGTCPFTCPHCGTAARLCA